ncbi:MFS transporter [Mammaliicoccus sp. I-M36]|uniref:MFS transporter n=1 Tax=Mammaliicoccus sp. I-M36 TaxID=2898695 RepID=UPI001EFBD3E7|nr:MFS transporter [Mammaliicoccus sp. I-M36]
MNKNELNLVTSKFTSGFGVTIFNTTINLYILTVYNSGEILGKVMAIAGISSVISSLLGGYLSDYYNKKSLLKFLDISSLILCLIAIPLSYTNNLMVILVLVFLLNMNNNFSSPVFKSLIPDIVTKDKIPRFNSRLATINELNKIGTPIVATYFFSRQIIDIQEVLFINAITYLLSYIYVNKVDIIDKNLAHFRKVSFFQSYKSSYSYIHKNHLLAYLVYTGFFSNIFLGGFNLILPLYATEVLGNNELYGIFLSFEAVGVLLGVFSSNLIKLDEKLISERILLLISGFLLIIPSIWVSKYSIILVCFILNFSLGRYNIALQNYIQINVEKGYLGKVFAVIFTLSALSGPLGSVVFGYITNIFLKDIFIIISIGIILINLIWILWVIKERYNEKKHIDN